MREAIWSIFDEAVRNHQAGCLADAAKLYREILAAEPGHADSLHFLGLIEYQLGRHQAATGLIARAIEARADVPSYYNNLGTVLLAQKKYGDATSQFEWALSIKPDYAEARFNLGCVLQTQGDLDGAVVCFETIVETSPDYVEAYITLGNTLQEISKFDAATALYRKALARWPDNSDIHNDLGCALQAQGGLAAAAACFQQALSIQPNSVKANYNLGHLLQVLDELEWAASCYERVLAVEPDHKRAHRNMGYLRHAQDRLDDAAVCYRRALSVKPDSADAHNELGNVLKDQGDFPGAVACYRRSIALKREHAKAHFNLADIRRYEPGDAELAALESLAADSAQLPPEDAPYIHIALAKALEDVGDYKRSFEHLLNGNALKRAQLTYDEATTRQYFQHVLAAFDGDVLARGATCEFSELPIFIVGMPRSGTTLVEQILATHCQVHAAGERINLDRIVGQMLGPDILRKYPLCVSALDAQTLLRIGQVYLSNLSSLSLGKLRATDKLPGNFFNVGLIRLILPNARIVHVTRNAADTCVSCFSKLFAQGHEFSYELGELGRYYLHYRALMDHWQSILPPGAMLELSYEALVGDFEGQARRLIEYCGLGWDDHCLDFHTTKRDISTASAVQVRQPIYRSALSRWRRFEPYISALLEELEPVLHET